MLRNCCCSAPALPYLRESVYNSAPKLFPLYIPSKRGSPMLQEDKCRILCVDDHADTSEMLTVLLSSEDYEVVTAVSMEEALDLARGEKFDLYVLDKHLPDGSGLDLCRKLNEVTPDVPCMFYTGD